MREGRAFPRAEHLRGVQTTCAACRALAQDPFSRNEAIPYARSVGVGRWALTQCSLGAFAHAFPAYLPRQFNLAVKSFPSTPSRPSRLSSCFDPCARRRQAFRVKGATAVMRCTLTPFLSGLVGGEAHGWNRRSCWLTLAGLRIFSRSEIQASGTEVLQRTSAAISSFLRSDPG